VAQEARTGERDRIGRKLNRSHSMWKTNMRSKDKVVRIAGESQTSTAIQLCSWQQTMTLVHNFARFKNSPKHVQHILQTLVYLQLAHCFHHLT